MSKRLLTFPTFRFEEALKEAEQADELIVKTSNESSHALQR